MSMDAFFNRLEKENKWGKMAYIITMILIVFPMIVDEFQKNAWFDALGLLVLLLIINYFVYRFMGNVYKIGNYYQSIVYQECIRLNMSFEEYYDYLNEEYKD